MMQFAFSPLQWMDSRSPIAVCCIACGSEKQTLYAYFAKDGDIE